MIANTTTTVAISSIVPISSRLRCSRSTITTLRPRRARRRV
jgi:hypothetical protein